jgi:CheY-like chemotaxis protein
VDDDIAVRNLLKEVLWQHGFIVWLAGTGLQALELYQELHAHIDLVLLDVRMPGLDGPGTLVALQRLNPDIQCCFMSADPGEYTEEELLERGAVRILQKPLHLSQVVCFLWDLVSPSETGEDRSKSQSRTEESMPELFLG